MKTLEYRDATGPHKVMVLDECNDPNMGIPHGEPWELTVAAITPEQIAQALRENNIWTIDDLRGDVKRARGALYGLVGATLRDLLDSTKEVAL
jgi:hypothetical protein